MSRNKKVLCVAYLVALACLVAHGVGCLVQRAYYRAQGLYPTATLTLDELEPYSIKQYENPDDPAGVWFVSTDSDPQLHWEQEAYLDEVTLQIEHSRPGLGVELYYKLPGQADYSERQVAYATRDAAGNYVFQLGGKLCSGIRVDPDSYGGIATRFDGLAMNASAPWWRGFVPTAGQWILLLCLPLLGAALVCLLPWPSAKKQEAGEG